MAKKGFRRQCEKQKKVKRYCSSSPVMGPRSYYSPSKGIQTPGFRTSCDDIAIPKKGAMLFDPTYAKYFAEKHGQIWKDRETNQLFYLKSVYKPENEVIFADSDYEGDKTALSYHIVLEPLFIRYATVNVSIRDVKEIQTPWSVNLNPEDPNFYLSSKIVIKSISNQSTEIDYAGPNLAGEPRFFWADGSFGGQYCALDVGSLVNFEGFTESTRYIEKEDEITLANPLMIGKGAIDSFGNVNEDYRISGYFGNFVYAHCAVHTPEGLLIGTTTGIWSCDLRNNLVENFKHEIVTNGFWTPLNMVYVYGSNPNPDITYLYVTVSFTPQARFPYMYNFGMDVSHHTPGHVPAYTTYYDENYLYIGHTAILKFELLQGKFDPNKVSVVYSHFGPDNAEADSTIKFEMSQETDDAYSGAMTGTCSTIFYDGQANHSVLLYDDDGTVGSISSNFDFNSPPFHVNVDSLLYRIEDTWDGGLYFKKGEYPFMAIHDKNGSFIRNAIVIGWGFPMDASNVRLVGYTVQSSEQLPAIPGQWHGTPPDTKSPIQMIPDYSIDPADTAACKNDVHNSCLLTCLRGCRYMRGHSAIIQYGNPMIGHDGKVRFLVTWDSHSLYTTFLAHRGYYVPAAGFTFWCDVWYSQPDCGISYGYVAVNTLEKLCAFRNTSVATTGGSLSKGIRWSAKWWQKMCGFFSPTTYSGGGFTAGGEAAAAGAGPSGGNPDCYINYVGGQVYKIHDFQLKDSKFYYLDMLTSLHSIFDVIELKFNPYEERTLQNIPNADWWESGGVNFYEFIGHEQAAKVGKIINDYRVFTDYNGPNINYTYFSDIEEATNPEAVNPLVKIENGDTEFPETIVAIQGSDTFKTSVLMDWAAGGSVDWRQRHEKRFRIALNINYSPYYYAKLKQYQSVTLLKREYQIGSSTLEEYLNNALTVQEGTQLTDVDKALPMVELSEGHFEYLFLWNSAFDFSFYAPIGQYSSCFIQDREKYAGNQNYTGTLIYEGYYVDTEGTSMEILRGDDMALNALYGGPDAFHLNDSEKLVVTRPVTFIFTKLKMTNKAGPLPNYIFPYEPGHEESGTIVEEYLVSHTPLNIL